MGSKIIWLNLNLKWNLRFLQNSLDSQILKMFNTKVHKTNITSIFLNIELYIVKAKYCGVSSVYKTPNSRLFRSIPWLLLCLPWFLKQLTLWRMVTSILKVVNIPLNLWSSSFLFKVSSNIWCFAFLEKLKRWIANSSIRPWMSSCENKS